MSKSAKIWLSKSVFITFQLMSAEVSLKVSWKSNDALMQRGFHCTYLMKQFTVRIIRKIRYIFLTFYLILIFFLLKNAQFISVLNYLNQYVAVMGSTIRIYVNWNKPNAWGTQVYIKYLMVHVLKNDQEDFCNSYFLFLVCLFQ